MLRLRLGDIGLKVVATLVMVYLFIPVAIIIVFSFNDPAGKFNFTWNEFSLDAWKNPTAFQGLSDALKTSLTVAFISTFIAVILGTMIALALVRYRFKGSGFLDVLLILPLTTPEVVMGSSLLTLFLDFGIPLGRVTIILAHIMFQISFVAMTVRARIRGFDWSLEDAAADLGAGPVRTFWTVTFPLILPGIVAAAMLSFALSLDDFIITVFNSGTAVTYPLYIDAAQKSAFPPQINVLATMILIGSLAMIGLVSLFQRFLARSS